MIYIRNFGVLLLAISLLFTGELSYAKHKSEDDYGRKSISRALKKDEAHKKKAQKKLAKKQKKRAKKEKAREKKLQKKLEKKRKKQKAHDKKKKKLSKKEAKKQKKQKKSSRRGASRQKKNPPLIKVPQVYFVEVKDLTKEQKRTAERLFNKGEEYHKKGIIRFSDSELGQNPTFDEFLAIKKKDRKLKHPNRTKIQTYSYEGPTKKKKTKWTFPWSTQ